MICNCNNEKTKIEIIDRVSNHEKCIAEITLDIEVANQYSSILVCVSYVVWQAFNYEKRKDFFFPLLITMVKEYDGTITKAIF